MTEAGVRKSETPVATLQTALCIHKSKPDILSLKKVEKALKQVSNYSMKVSYPPTLS
jgi:hypothetical protein